MVGTIGTADCSIQLICIYMEMKEMAVINLIELTAHQRRDEIHQWYRMLPKFDDLLLPTVAVG